MFKHYKRMPSFPIIKDNRKKRGQSRGGGQAPTARSNNPYLGQSFFFHKGGYLNINYVDSIWFNLI